MNLILKTTSILLLGGALWAGPFHEGKTALSPEEQALVLQDAQPSAGFHRLWRAPGFTGSWHLLKWDAEHSSAVPDAPSDLLDGVREEVGRVNQPPGKGEDLFLTVTVYRYKRQGFLTNPVGYFELVARDAKGQPIWMALDQIKTSQSLAESLADSDSRIMGRELHRKIRQSFGK